MRTRGWVVALAVAGAALTGAAAVAAQEVSIKGGLAISKFDVEGTTPFDERLIATSFGGHIRFALGPLTIQPEIHVITRGGTIGAADDDESLRLEYLELPVLFSMPFHIGTLEVAPLIGPMVALETRCRYIFETEGLKTNVGCDPPREPLFRRRAADYGVVAGGALSHRLGGGRLMLEGRHTWGFRNIYDGDDGTELRNRSMVFMIGYTLMWSPEPF